MRRPLWRFALMLWFAIHEALYKEGVAAAVRAGEGVPYYEERRYYIDDNLITLVTSIEGHAIVTPRALRPSAPDHLGAAANS